MYVIRLLQKFSVQMLLSILCALIIDFINPLPQVILEPMVELVIRIHQLPIIPYIIISILIGVGSLDRDQAFQYAKRILVYTGVIWLISLSVLFLTGLVHTSIDHSKALRMIYQNIDIAHLVGMNYVSNISSLFGGMTIPAIIVVIILFSVALFYCEDRKKIIRPLAVFSQVFERIFAWFLQILPLSVFFLLSHALSVFNMDFIAQTVMHLLAVLSFFCFITFLIFPSILKIMRGVAYPCLIKNILPCLWLTFLAGDCVVALPLMILSLKKLLRDQCEIFDTRMVGVVVPICFALPLAGSIGNLMFLYFAASIYGVDLGLLEHLKIVILGAITMFAEPLISVPLMLESLKMPHDSVPLFMLLSSITDLFFDACETFSIILLSYMVVTKPRPWLNFSRVIKLIFSFAIIAMGWLFFVSQIDSESFLLSSNMNQNISLSPNEKVMKKETKGVNVFEELMQNKVIRVGVCHSDSFFCRIDNGKVEGFEIDLIRELAGDLGVRAEFIRVTDGADSINKFEVDLLACQGIARLTQLKNMAYLQPIVEGTLVVLMKKLFDGSTAASALAHFTYSDEANTYTNIHKWDSSSSTSIIVPDVIAKSYKSKYLLSAPEKRKSYIIAWSTHPRAVVWSNFVNQWITVMKVNPKWRMIYDKWFVGPAQNKD